MKLEKEIDKFYDGTSISNFVRPRIGRRFNQDDRKPVMVIAPFFYKNSAKDADQIVKDFLNGLDSEELRWDHVCVHYFLPFPIRMTYLEFLDADDLHIRPKGVTQADFLNARFSQNICNKLHLESVQSQKKISTVNYRPENINYDFIKNAADYLVEVHKDYKKRDFDEYYMQSNYIEEQLLGVDCLRRVIDIVQPNTIIFTDRKTRNLVKCAFANEKRFEKYAEGVKTRIREKAKQIKEFEAFLKMDLSKKCVERYKQYIRDWYQQARGWDLTAYVENRDAEARRENWTLDNTFDVYLGDSDRRVKELSGFDDFLAKNEPANNVQPHPTTKPVGNGAEVLFGKLEQDLGAALERCNLYEKYKLEYESHARNEAMALVSKLKEGNSADADITDENIETILSGLYPEKSGVPKFVLWKEFINKLEEPARESFLNVFRGIVALRTEQKSTAEPSSEHSQEDRNERLKQALKSENRIHRLSDLDAWVEILGDRIDTLKKYVAGGDEGEKFIERDGLLELIDKIQWVQTNIAEIVKKMKELGDAREVREEPKKTVRNLSSLQGNKKDARLVLKEKMKKQ